MAIDNLNYYSSWLPAGQQTDRYSSQPWCLKSKNLDIFSSSKSVKATAWSEPTTTDSDVIKQDWKLVLKTDWKVYERENGVDTLFVDPSVNFPSYDVCYTGWRWTYAPAIRGTAQDMAVAKEWDEWRSFIVFTDRASFVYSKNKFIYPKTFSNLSGLTYDDNSPWEWAGGDWGYCFTKTSSSSQSASVDIRIDNSPFWEVPIRIFANEDENADSNISLNKVVMYDGDEFYYDPQLDWITPKWVTSKELSFTGDITTDYWVTINIPITPKSTWYTRVTLYFKWTPKVSSYARNNGEIYIDMNWWAENRHMMKQADGTLSDWDSNYYYSYLPLRERSLVEVWSYAYSNTYWMKWVTFQPLYKWTSSWVYTGYRDKNIIYDFVQDMGWENDPWMDIIWMMIWNEQVYMVGNMDSDWYIIPCDLTWGRWTPYVAYGCKFKGVTNIDYLLYLVWEDRWISTLWVFNNQELVPIVWGREEKETKNLIRNEEQYKFEWRIVNWRKNLILATEDNRIFQYWQTYGGKWGVFIHELPENANLTWMKDSWNDLEISYSITESWITTKYIIKYQDDAPIKNYNTEWMAEYPIVLWNHLLEKEESDLYASYILPSSSCKLEFWGMANHYHFWTFTSEDDATLSTSVDYKLKWATGTYNLKFLEKNWNQYTFRLEWNLPVQTTNDMKITDSEWVDVITYSDFNHFRKIWEIETDKYCEWEFRFHNLNNKLELPKSHSLQIMVKGKGTAQYTPELFALDLVANQRERW